MTVEAAPAFLRALDQLEDHGERGLVRQAALRADRTVAHRCKRALDRVRGAQGASSARRGNRRMRAARRGPWPGIGGLLVFEFVAFDERVERGLGIAFRLGHPDLVERTLGFGLLALRQLV